MGLEDKELLSPTDLTLRNKSGNVYYYKPYECNSPAMFYEVSGKRGTEMTFTHCYTVEKEFKEFDAYYHNSKVGSFVLN